MRLEQGTVSRLDCGERAEHLWLVSSALMVASRARKSSRHRPAKLNALRKVQKVAKTSWASLPQDSVSSLAMTGHSTLPVATRRHDHMGRCST